VTTERLRFAPDILRRLGEELNPHPEQGIIELVRNAYDADALSCTVELSDTAATGGTVRIEDDGFGMDRESITSGWLVLGRSAKGGRQPTPLGRLQVGDKGLGRLAALRLGHEADLRTRPSVEPGMEYRVLLDWDRFDAAKVVEDVLLEIDEETTSDPQGTAIEIRRLRHRLGRREIRRLARQLLLLAAPFEGPEAFRPRLIAEGFEDLERLVAEQFFGDAEFYLEATLGDGGRAAVTLQDWRGDEVAAAGHDDLAKGRERREYETAQARLQFWVFILDRSSFARRASAARVGEVSDWLGVVGGVHIYHRGLRVHPYGDAGHDWLELNLRRARDPEYRPSTNTSLGRVLVEDPDNRLVQKTDRSGFIENEAFSELREFANDALEWMHDWRYRDAQRRRDEAKRAAPGAVHRARRGVDRTLERLPPDTRASVQSSLDRLERARDREVRLLREDVQLYRTLSTIGTTTAIFAHESAKPIDLIGQSAQSLAKRGRRHIPDEFKRHLAQPLLVIEASVEKLRTFSALPLRLLKRDKRRAGAIDVHRAIADTVDLFEPFLSDAGITVDQRLSDERPRVRTSVAALESIVANFLINSIGAFGREDAPRRDRRIVLRTDVSDSRLLLQILDNGPGIPTSLATEDVWVPGRTTTEGGTGLGLTIVRDAVKDMEGEVHAQRHGELGGAEFSIELPLIVESSDGRR
jgi:C4-dicarboxylate-specific signal transduction histidine kinase